MVLAIAMLALALIPIAFAFVQETEQCRALYYRAVAMEIVDGEMEILAAGEWRAFTLGQHAYAVQAEAVTNLPPGAFQLTLDENRVRLEWIPGARSSGGRVVRELKLK
jgi:hypothetical protein